MALVKGLVFGIAVLLQVIVTIWCQERELTKVASGLSIVRPAYSPETCCQKRYQYKYIERKIYENGIEYDCKGYVSIGYCGGECKVESEYTPPCYLYVNGTWEELDGKAGSTSYASTVCQSDLTADTKKKLQCKATRECCEDVKQVYTSILVSYKEPVTCSCKPLKEPKIDVPCHRVDNWRYHVFWLDRLYYCRSEYLNLPYCSGCCKSQHHQYSLSWPANLNVDKSACTCCSKIATSRRWVSVTCYSRFRKSKEDILPTDDDTALFPDLQIFDDAGNNITNDQVKAQALLLGGWKGRALLYYITTCGCNHTECPEYTYARS